MITIDGVQYRNLEEQVNKNKDDIAYILEEEGVLNEFGIKIVGEVDTAGDLPDPTTYEGNFGDAYAVGTSDPYTLYIFTRANGSHPTNYWFNIGQFPVPGPKGEQGPQGIKGDTGTRGSIWKNGTSVPTSTSGYLTDDKYLNTTNGDVYNYNGSTWQLMGNIRGPQGIQGQQGNVGPVGPQGIQGPVGPQGNPGQSFVIAGTVANSNQLPDPSTVADNIAYLVGTQAPYDLYVQLQDSSEWFNAGIVEGVQGPQGPQGVAGRDALFLTTTVFVMQTPEVGATLQGGLMPNSLNRTATAGEVGFGVFKYAMGNRSWYCTFTLSGSGDPYFTATFKSVVELTGQKGDTGPQGTQGIQGEQGPQGPKGDPGGGVPAGGTTGQYLIKKSDTDYETEWSNPTPLYRHTIRLQISNRPIPGSNRVIAYFSLLSHDAAQITSYSDLEDALGLDYPSYTTADIAVNGRFDTYVNGETPAFKLTGIVFNLRLVYSRMSTSYTVTYVDLEQSSESEQTVSFVPGSSGVNINISDEVNMVQ